jgi:hypothetical protein
MCSKCEENEKQQDMVAKHNGPRGLLCYPRFYRGAKQLKTSSHSLPPPVHQNNEERKCAQNVRRTRSSRTWWRSTMARGACSATQGSTGVPSSLRRVRIHYLLQSIRTTKKENVLRMRGEREAAGHGCEAQRPAALALLLPKVLPAGCQAA